MFWKSSLIFMALNIYFVNSSCILPLNQMRCCANVFRLSEQVRVNGLAVYCDAKVQNKTNYVASNVCNNLMCIYECVSQEFVSFTTKSICSYEYMIL